MIVKKRNELNFCSNDSAYQAPKIFILIYTLICENVRFVRGCMNGQLASVILPGIFLLFFLFCLLCFSVCIYLTGLHPRGDQAQLHPQCGVRLPFSQRRAEAAFNNSCAMLLKKNKKTSLNTS